MCAANGGGTFETVRRLIATQEMAQRVGALLNGVMWNPLPPDYLSANSPSANSQAPSTIDRVYGHGLGVAYILHEWSAPEALVCAGLLHPFIWQKAITLEQVAQACGPRVAALCEEHHRILNTRSPNRWSGSRLALRRIHHYMAAYKDPELAFLMVADRLERLAGFDRMEGTQRRKMVEETAQATVPLLDFLGMGKLKREWALWAARNGARAKDFVAITRHMEKARPLLKDVYARVKADLQTRLPQAQIRLAQPDLVALYDPSLPEKINSEAFQSIHVDLTLDTPEACYAALHQLHQLGQPIDGGVVDTIGQSPLNGHRSLNTAVQIAVEQSAYTIYFSLCTHQMARINDWGLVALLLNEGAADKTTDKPAEAWWQHRHRGNEQIETAPLGSMPDNFYVFSPQGELFPMQRGYTVVDYAYSVHSKLAHQVHRFQVNGREVAPTAALNHLDLVELIYRADASGPNHIWLEAAHNSKARSNIQRYLRKQERGSQRGRRILLDRKRELEEHYQFDIASDRLNSVLNGLRRSLDKAHLDEVYAEIADGNLHADQILHPLFSDDLVRQINLPAGVRVRHKRIKIAQCCRPVPGDAIIGRPKTHNEAIVEIKVHQTECPAYQRNRSDDEMALKWAMTPASRTIKRVDMIALDDDGLLGHALEAIYAHSPTELYRVQAEARYGQARMQFTIEANPDVLDQICQDLQHLPGHLIERVQQMQILLSEWDDLAIPHSPALNPFSRLPVDDRDMLFGRTNELALIDTYLQTGAGLIAVRGQKRIGKTSLLLHLAKHHLKQPQYVPIFIDFQYFSRTSGPGFFYEMASAIYGRLQTDGRLRDVGPPSWDAFKVDPAHQFERYLRTVQSNFPGHLVLLLDEFSATIDAYHRGRLTEQFFHQLRGVIPQLRDWASFVAVVQQKSYDQILAAKASTAGNASESRESSSPLLRENPAWQLLEIGEQMQLAPLSRETVRQLVTQPMRGILTYDEPVVDHIIRLTGGSPFMVQAFCYELLLLMANENRTHLQPSDLSQTQRRFMIPEANLFAHLLDMAPGAGQRLIKALAQLSGVAGAWVPLPVLADALPISAAIFNKVVQDLTEKYVLEQEPEGVRFASQLFCLWLLTCGY